MNLSSPFPDGYLYQEQVSTVQGYTTQSQVYLPHSLRRNNINCVAWLPRLTHPENKLHGENMQNGYTTLTSLTHAHLSECACVYRGMFHGLLS